MIALFTTRLMRASFLLTVILVMLIPLYAIWVSHPAFRDLMIRFTETHAVQLAGHMAESVRFDADGKVEVTDGLRAEMMQLASGFHLYKYRLFDHQGVIILSSVSEEIGKRNEHAYFHEIVAKGQIHSLTVQKNHKSLENEQITLDVVETYVPIMRDQQFSGAFEIYFEITSWLQSVERIVMQASLVVGALAILLFTVIVLSRFRVMQRIVGFMQAFQTTSKGEFAHHLPLVGQDELTDMARNFNAMSDELHKLHRGLQNEKNKLTTIILSAREGIVVTDDQGVVVLVNPAAERLLGKESTRIQQDGFLGMIDDPAFVGQYLENNGMDMPKTIVYNHRVLHFHASTIHNREGEPIGSAAMLRDITEEKKLEESLRNQSITDVLTGLYNRRHAMTALQDELLRFQRSGQVFSIAMLDVDFFKRFNDQYGHDQGDRVLQAVGKSLVHHYRQIDLCCRLGGEEFCVIMPGTVLKGATLAAQRLRHGIEEMEVDGLRVTVSIGVAECDPEIPWPDELLKRADQALYAAKHRGRNQVVQWSAGLNRDKG
ncbi:MAG: diguanylate cyclase [Magnetococcales bacterium]|nr:diguanylate cyclase [Magnetococcales bacterium]